MTNIIKIFYNHQYDKVYENLNKNLELYNNDKFKYIRAITEYKLFNFEDCYITLKNLLDNKKNKDLLWEKFIRVKSFDCLKKIKSKKVKISYDKKYINLNNDFKWIISGILCKMSLPNINQIKVLEFYNIRYAISFNINNNLDIFSNSNIKTLQFNINLENCSNLIIYIDLFCRLVYNCYFYNSGLLLIDSDKKITDLFLICYYIRYGTSINSSKIDLYDYINIKNFHHEFPKLSPSYIFDKKKNLNNTQIHQINMYYKCLWNRYNFNNNLEKYPSVLLLPFSKNIYNENNNITNISYIANITKIDIFKKDVVITHCLDGYSFYLNENKLYISNKTIIINDLILNSISDNIRLYGILKEKLDFNLEFVFNDFIKKITIIGVFDDSNNIWLSWEETKNICLKMKLTLVEDIFYGQFNDYYDLLNQTYSNYDLFDSYIIRPFDRFSHKNFNNNVFKFIK